MPEPMADPPDVKRWVSSYGNSAMIEEPTGNYVHVNDIDAMFRYLLLEEYRMGYKKALSDVSVRVSNIDQSEAARSSRDFGRGYSMAISDSVTEILDLRENS